MFKADKSFFEIFPNAKLGVVVIKNMDNTKNSDEIITLLENVLNEALDYIVENSKKYTLGDANKYILDRENSSLEL